MQGTRISVRIESSIQYFPQWLYENLDDYCISAHSAREKDDSSRSVVYTSDSN